MTYKHGSVTDLSPARSMAVSATKNQRINRQLRRNAKNLVERAVTFEGKIASGFILPSVPANAEKATRAHQFIRFNEQDVQRFSMRCPEQSGSTGS